MMTAMVAKRTRKRGPERRKEERKGGRGAKNVLEMRSV